MRIYVGIMEIIEGLDRLTHPYKNAVVTLGNFDGVHLGHQKIFQRVKEEARRLQGQGVIITFNPHPLKVLAPERCPPLLTPFRKKMLLFEQSGVDHVVSILFSKSFSEISPEAFIHAILIEKIGARKVIVGYNYHFGRGKGGTVQTLQTLCMPRHVDVEVVEALTVDGLPVSSSKVRALLQEGEVEKASRLLGRDYSVIGKVIPGAHRGRGLGFPTANLEISEELYPKPGVYAVEVLCREKRFHGVANLGFNPTFTPEGKEREPMSLEVHLFDFGGDLYGEEIWVSFRKRIRDERRFDSPSLLVEQMRRDVHDAREALRDPST